MKKKNRDKKRVLVTGGAGFIGSHLCERLLDASVDVLCVDNFSTSVRSNILHLLSRTGFEFHHHDIIDPLDVDVDEIYNLACPASPVHYQSRPVITIKTNVIGTINMLELARKTEARILQASTSEVYGDPDVHPQSESYLGNVNPIGPRACYDEGKRCAETLFFDYCRLYNLDICIARMFNTYGPRMMSDDGRVIPTFINQALSGKALTINGDGSQTRSFCYIDDMVDGLVKLMESDFRGPVNLGNPKEISIEELAAFIAVEIQSGCIITYLSASEDDPKRRCPDIQLANVALAWNPVVSLDEGLRKTIDYFRGTRGRKV